MAVGPVGEGKWPGGDAKPCHLHVHTTVSYLVATYKALRHTAGSYLLGSQAMCEEEVA